MRDNFSHLKYVLNDAAMQPTYNFLFCMNKKSQIGSAVISDLLSAKLHSLAALSAASTTLRVERRYSLTLLEWRSIGQLGGFAPLSLKALAQRTGMEKSYASRTVSILVERGLVVSTKSAADAREIIINLTPTGQKVYEEVLADALARNERILRPLSAERREMLMEMLTELTESARQVLKEERLITQGALEDTFGPESVETKQGGRTQKAEVDVNELKSVAARLQQIISRLT